MAPAPHRGGARLNAHGGMSAVFSAQASLDDACAELDAAVLGLTEVDGETVLANAQVMALLFRAANARRHLADLQGPTTWSPSPHLP